MATTKGMSAGAVGTAAALTAAAAAAAAGAYWLYGAKDAAKHRRMAKSWMLKARAEVMDAVEMLSDVDKAKYLAIVDDVVKKYSKTADSAEVKRLVADLKSSWSYISQQKAPATRRAKAVKKSATKVAKKTRR